MLYTLHNKRLDKNLTHPKYGVWCTSDIKEARDMLNACLQYLTTSNIPKLEFNNFVILDLDTGEEVEIE